MACLRITALLVNSFSLVADETLGCFHGHFSSFLPQTPPTSPWHPGPYSLSALCCLNVPCTLHAHSEAGIWASTKEWEVRTIHIRGRSERGVREKYWDLKLNFFFSVSNTTKKLVEGWFIYVPQIVWTNIYCDCYTQHICTRHLPARSPWQATSLWASIFSYVSCGAQYWWDD